MAIQCSAVFLVPAAASMAPPTGARLPAGALVVVPGAAFAMVAPGGASATTTTTARRVVLAAAPGVALPQGGGGPADARLRRGVVCFQAGGTPSSGDDEAKIEAVAFKAAMEAFEDTFRPLALVSSNEKVPLSLVENVLKEVKDSADGCGQLLRLAIHVVPITQEQLQELIGAGDSFATLDGECMEGYLRAVSLVGAIDGAKRMCTVLSARIDNFLPIDTVSASGDDNDLDKEKYFTNLSKEFYCLYEHMCQKLYHHLHIVT